MMSSSFRFMCSGFMFLFLVSACGAGPKSQISKLKEAWDKTNDPEQMGLDILKRQNPYKSRFSDLPLSGFLPKTPWSDTYWPTYEGGIAFRWNDEKAGDKEKINYKMNKAEELSKIDMKTLSPAEKYDIYLDRFDYPLTNVEFQRTEVLKTIEGSPAYDPDFIIPEWEGLCHAWAPATLFYESPAPTVMKNKSGMDVPFGSSDVKALLTYFIHSAPTDEVHMLGGRCEKDFYSLWEKVKAGKMSKREFKREIYSSECRDTNAGAFHIVLANQIGLLKEGFIVDTTTDQEVWNQPVWGYETEVVSVKNDSSRYAARGTVKEVTVKTKMHYIKEIWPSWDGAPQPQDSNLVMEYNYVLELNRNGEIIGGEWLSNGTFNETRPDFMWKQSVPDFSGFFAPLKELYNASILKK
ncbi:MAG: hypothetical protein HQK54_09630 [Oligoflexales bacterium]|nr:hypothetical protein [Oligoflexales bacterium]